MTEREGTAPSDWQGASAVRVMLEDVDFPTTAGALRERAGNWKVPLRASHETVSLAEALGDVDDDERFGSAEDVASAVARRLRL